MLPGGLLQGPLTREFVRHARRNAQREAPRMKSENLKRGVIPPLPPAADRRARARAGRRGARRGRGRRSRQPVWHSYHGHSESPRCAARRRP
jgi:hypothetical protein